MLFIVEIRTVCTGKCVAIIYLLFSVSYNTRLVVLGELVGLDVVSGRRRVRASGGGAGQVAVRHACIGLGLGLLSPTGLCADVDDALVTLTRRLDSTLPLG